MKEPSINNIPNELLSPSEDFLIANTLMDIQWWNWDHVERKLLVSPKLLELLGYTEEEYDPSVPTIEKNIHPGDIERNLREFTKLVHGEIKFYEMEYRLKVDGTWQWYYNRGTVVSRDDDGNILMIGGITMNISSRFNRMLTNVEEGSKFEFLFKHSSEPILIGKIDVPNCAGHITEANKAAGALFECESDVLLGKNPFDLLNTGSIEEREMYVKRIMSEGSLLVSEHFYTSNGEKKYVEIEAHLLPMNEENLFISVLKDKTESFLVKKELKESEQALRESERLYRELIQSADDRIALYDLEGTLLVVNSAFYECLGFTADEYDGLNDYQRVHPDDREYLLNLRKQKGDEGSISAQYRVQHKNGQYLTMSSKSVLIKDEELQKEYVLFIIRDISESIAFQKELIKAKEKAVESDLLKSAFLANMSHEIRTPMNSIIGFANLLSDGGLDENSRKEYVSRINRNSEQLLALISDIIDLAKIESNQLTISHSKVLLESLFLELLNYGEMQIKNRKKLGLQLLFEPEKEFLNAEIDTDLVRLTQIMQNLLNNAVKFTIEGEIKIGYSIQDKKITFYVKDTGIGIDSKNFDVIFDQFRQVDGSHTRRFGGTGLGLAICRNLSGLLGGRIWVESEKGKGSSFFVELPLVNSRGVQPIHVDEPKKSTKEKSDISILLVDDDPDSLMLISTILRHEGIKVISAESGYRALELLDRGVEPNLLLLDLEMPILNGLLTFKLVKELYPKLIVVAQSAHALEGDKQKSLEMGFSEYLVKPYSKDELMNVLTKVLS